MGQQAVLEAVAVMLLKMAVVGGIVFLSSPRDSGSGTVWLVGIKSDIFGAESIYGIRKGWIALET